ncbi:MAG: YbhB/YbcL family Raf kinase inhibitor-like protein [Pseudomonadota bacterium]|nr:YbhB/YbcL family Raf kinase inhibitor-like protein [Pseudomonadota bacterium]
MKLSSSSFQDHRPIPGDFAFCVPAPGRHVASGGNRNPAFEWSGMPDGTQSLVLLCVDPDVPGKADDVNQEGRQVPAGLARVDFYHWVLVDLPPGPSSIRAGEFSDGVTPRGKPGPLGPRGTRQGLNNYTQWFAADADMAGNYFGYDGPCPPWNDSIVHHYVFTLYALDVARCPVAGEFTGADVRRAIEGHVLAQASLTGTYSLNPKVRA